MPQGPDILIIGHVTRDLVGGEERLGGAAAFASRAAACLGLRVGLVTAAPAGFSLMAPVAAEPKIDLVRRDAREPTTFALDYSGPERRVHLHARAPSLVPEDVPSRFARAGALYLAPVIGECPLSLGGRFAGAFTIAGLQGYMRDVAPDGRIVPKPRPELPEALHVATFSELDHPEAEGIAQALARRVPVVALTRGARGVTLFARGGRREVPAAPAHEVDPTGAGDVFGLVLGWSLRQGFSLDEAVDRARHAAARVVEGPGLGKLEAWPT